MSGVLSVLKVILSDEPNHPPMVVPTRMWQGVDSLDADEVMQLYREHGAIVFRGFRLTKKGFWKLGSQYCKSFVRNSSSGRKVISRDKRVQSVGLGGDLFPFHPEIARAPWRPDVAIFGCLKAPAKGGETLISDGCEMVRKMSPELRELLSSRQFHYWSPTTEESAKRWLDVDEVNEEVFERLSDKPPFRFKYDDEGNLFKIYIAPGLHTPMFSDDPCFGSFLLFARFFHKNKKFPTFDDGSMVSDEICRELNELAYSIAYSHKWEKSDVLMIDNTRFLHARPDFNDDGSRQIITQFGYLHQAKVSPEEELMPWRQKSVWLESDQV
jgi:alpha-ketoglutarate-dependent taurine dioxygenase